MGIGTLIARTADKQFGPVRVEAIVPDLGTLTPPGGKDTDNDHHP